MVIIIVKNVIPKIIGFLSLLMSEAECGVFVADLNSKVRGNVWKVISSNIGDGYATIIYKHDGRIKLKKIGKQNKRDVINNFGCFDLVGFRPCENEGEKT